MCYFIISIPIVATYMCSQLYVYVYRLTMLMVYNYLASDVTVVIMEKWDHTKLLCSMNAYAWAMPTPWIFLLSTSAPSYMARLTDG